MDDRLYYMFMTLLLAFQTQFRNIMENRSGRRTAGLNEHGNLREISFQSAAYYRDLKQLTEIEQQTFALEEDLRRAMIEISRSPRSLSRWRKDLMVLQQQLENLQAQLRTEIGTLSQSRGQHQMRIIFSRISMLKHQKQLEDQERRGRSSRSCPNIPSELYDSDFDLIKWMSRNESLNFRKGPDDIRKMFDNIHNLLDTLHNPHMKKKKKTSALHSSILSLDRHQQEMARLRAQFNNVDQITISQTRPSQGPIRDTGCPHWNQTRLRMQQETVYVIPQLNYAVQIRTYQTRPSQEMARPRAQFSNADQITINQTQPSQEMARLRAQFNNTIQIRTNQPRPSQNDNGIRRSASSAHDSNSRKVKKAKQDKVPTTEVKPVVKSCGSPSFSETNISTAIYKTMTAICATIFMAIYFE